MFVDSRRALPTPLDDTDICVIGAGAAGIAMAHKLRSTGLRVLVLESGGFELEARTQALTRGRNAGRDYWALDTSRLRYFGGSTNHWTGWCRPFDAMDFVERRWVPHSGWPLNRDQLEGHYAEAQELCELGALDYDGQRWAERTGKPLIPLKAKEFDTIAWQFSPPTRFGSRYRSALEEAENVQVLLYANATHLQLNAAGTRLESVCARTLDGAVFRVAAKSFVLALGGLDNPRLMLASNDVHRRGIGNHHDVLGRFFADHPHSVVGTLFTDAPATQTASYSDIVRLKRPLPPAIRFSWALAERAQRDQQLLGFSASLEPLTSPRFDDAEARAVDAMAREFYGRRAQHAFEVFVRTEQAPTWESRVTLDRSRDELGVPQVVLHWQVDERTRAALKRSVELLAGALGRSNVGRLFSYAHSGTRSRGAWPELWGGHHHMGTTRMSADPKLGVVDSDARVHGVDNLYCAGSSVFATTGYANPTLTLVALALRLADHLRERCT